MASHLTTAQLNFLALYGLKVIELVYQHSSSPRSLEEACKNEPIAVRVAREEEPAALSSMNSVFLMLESNLAEWTASTFYLRDRKRELVVGYNSHDSRVVPITGAR